ncbi:NUDIX hydrolase [Clostridium weizhouense]|uniref:CoA pyrophosphatase n=1 Tax=Clostridium weizhouense TaxID=2859781 RepID=A0ABS7ALP5_9CLOT|nr:CoA pyrophosphatase [Clostridium weizhouense]MBW6409557.1 CoA pyrophosphatase [Clostridium weizhouense]
MNLSDIKNKIKGTKPYINGWKQAKRASIIVPLIQLNNKLYVLFEVRAKKLNSQPGDICFPGGKIDFKETPKQAALRETYEELGIKDIEIINELDTVVRYDGMIIHPFLSIIKDIKNIKINKSEVDHVFYVPVDYLLNHKPLEAVGKLIVKREDDFPYDLIVNGENYKFKEGPYRYLFYKYKDYVIWGITAGILKNFLDEL